MTIPSGTDELGLCYIAVLASLATNARQRAAGRGLQGRELPGFR